MGSWPCSSNKAVLGQHTLIISLVLFTSLITVSASGSCELQECWDLYNEAMERLEVRDSERPKHMTPVERDSLCIVLRTFRNCIQNITRNGGCTGNLNFHGSSRAVENQMKRNSCNSTGPVYIASEFQDRTERQPDFCTYEGPSGHQYCELFGDPHLRTFNNQVQTCRVRGAWPLVSNDILTVQVTNDVVGAASIPATAASKLTVVINRNEEECAGSRYMTYQAQSDQGLPSTFTDGTHRVGRQNSVQIRELEPGYHVEIFLRYVDITLNIRLVGDYFTFSMKMPTALVNATSRINHDLMQLCLHGCPADERLDLPGFLFMQPSDDSSRGSTLSRRAAELRCTQEGLSHYYYESCIYDLMTSGNMQFLESAKYALDDAQRLFPEGLSSVETYSDSTSAAASGGSSILRIQRTPYWLGSGSPGTLCLLLVMCCLAITHTRTRHSS